MDSFEAKVVQIRKNSSVVLSTQGQGCTQFTARQGLQMVANLPQEVFDLMNKNELLQNCSDKMQQMHVLYGKMLYLYEEKLAEKNNIIENLKQKQSQ